jgi:hypothetical protein
MVGGNREAAEYSGVNVRAIIGSVMVISAVCSGLAGMLGVAYFGSAQQEEFDSYLLDSLAAVVVGGTSLFGGQGGIGNTIMFIRAGDPQQWARPCQDRQFSQDTHSWIDSAYCAHHQRVRTAPSRVALTDSQCLACVQRAPLWFRWERG